MRTLKTLKLLQVPFGLLLGLLVSQLAGLALSTLLPLAK